MTFKTLCVFAAIASAFVYLSQVLRGFGSGKANGVSWQPTGAGAAVDLVAFRHEFSESDEGSEVTSTIHDGVQAFVDSILRGEGTASFHLNSDVYPWDNGISAGAAGVIFAKFGPTGVEFSIPVHISRVNYQNEVAGGCDYNVTFKLNAEAGTYS
jgi:hypothetical protein